MRNRYPKPFGIAIPVDKSMWFGTIRSMKPRRKPMTMKFGIFDHMDQGSVPLGAQYESRLRLIEAYDRAGFHALSPGRAPRDAARHGAVAQRVSRRGRPTHPPAAVRPAGLYPQPVSSAARRGRDLHARPDERRSARGRHRPRHFVLRAALLWRRSDQCPGDLCRSPRGDPAGADPADGEFRRAGSSSFTTCRSR